MKVLIDECVPKEFKASLAAREHTFFTVPEAGLAGKQNGELLDLAEGKFDLFITLDRGIQYQQNLGGRKLSIILIRAKSNRLVDLTPSASECLEIMRLIQPGQLVVVGN